MSKNLLTPFLVLNAGALQLVLLISAYILLIISGFILLYTNFGQMLNHVDFLKKQSSYIESALVIYENSENYMIDFNNESPILLFDELEQSKVFYKAEPWGLYINLKLQNFNKKITYNYLMGMQPEYIKKAALNINNPNPLFISGNTSIDGNIILSNRGIKHELIEGNPFSGNRITANSVVIEKKYLALIDSIFKKIESDKTLCSLPLKSLQTSLFQGISQPFDSDCTLVITSNELYLQNASINNKVIIHSDKIIIDSSSTLENIIVYANYAHIESGFQGSLQLFVKDSIIIENNVSLQNPSGIILKSDSVNPYLYFGVGSSLSGYMILINENGQELSSQTCTIEDNSCVNGFLYINGKSVIKGKIKGNAFLENPIHKTENGVYRNTLFNSVFIQDNNCIYPITGHQSSGIFLKRIKRIR